MNKRAKFSLLYYIIIFISILLFESLLFSGPEVKELPYSEFRNLLAENKIESVVITQDKISGILKPSEAKKEEPPAAGTEQKKKAAVPTQPEAKKEAPAQTRTTLEKKPGVLKAPEVNKEETAKAQTIQKNKTWWPKLMYPPWRLRLKQIEMENKDRLKRSFTVIPLKDEKLTEDLQSHGVDYRGKITSDWFENIILNWIIPFGLLFVIWGFLFRRMGGGANVLNVGKSKAKIYAQDTTNKVTFKDVAGIDEAVAEVQEVVDFLSAPEKYTRLGGKLPKGVLLVGAPGTGKTLLARAVAGEAKVPFFSMSGSGFVEMFVGVGAARVRDLFTEAKTKAPCIIFIDELDAVGKSRGQGGPFMGGYDERENTLNQLLTEMDGFDPQAGIIIMGATNRPEVLDAALMRPGRFDRQILVDRPDLNGRVQIFKVHTRGLVLSRDVDLQKLAAETPGFAGAEIANVCNEAALLASRKNHDMVNLVDFQEAIERLVAGLEKKNKLINPKERRIVAYHESGHALVGHFTPGADPVQKVSIVPRGIGALGYTMQTPLEDRYLMSHSELLGKIKGLLGGRAAEELVFGEISTGASNDLEKSTRIVKDMITIYGMSTQAPNISFVERNENRFLGQGPLIARRSEKVEQMIDDEMIATIKACYEDSKNLIRDHREQLEKLAATLLEKENIDEQDIRNILGPPPECNKL
jgi:cell division protease FtsH